MKISAIVLAAGESRRMGRQKLLLPIGEKPVIARIVDELMRCELQSTLVVVGRDGEGIRAALAGRTITFVENPDRTGDMLNSVRSGLRNIPAGIDAVLVVLGDQPNVTSGLVQQLMAAFRADGRGIIVPTHGGHRGHPVLIASSFCEELASRPFEFGLRSFLDLHTEQVVQVEIQDAAVLADMDTPADYQRYLAGSSCTGC